MRILDEPYSDLPQTKLPTNGDALKAVHFEQNVPKQTKEAAIRTVAKKIKDIWKKTTIPSVSVERIVQKLTELYDAHSELSHATSTPAIEEKKISLKVRIFCCFLFEKVFNLTNTSIKSV